MSQLDKDLWALARYVLNSDGEMAERLNAVVLKTIVPHGTGGSNPSLSAISTVINCTYNLSHVQHNSWAGFFCFCKRRVRSRCFLWLSGAYGHLRIRRHSFVTKFAAINMGRIISFHPLKGKPCHSIIQKINGAYNSR